MNKKESWQYGKLTKWRVDEMPSCQNGTFIKLQMRILADWYLLKLKVDKMVNW
jgi:hypothetical protein